MNLKCLNCGHLMEDDLYCLLRIPMGDDDAVLAKYFEGYRIELWKCPECGQHRVCVAKDRMALLDIIFDPFQPGKLKIQKMLY